MRLLTLTLAASIAVIVAAPPGPAFAQADRDFVFTDEEGHLILRFVGSDAAGLTPSQREEVVNVSLSTMVHDRLRADLAFEAEPADAPWAGSMEPRIEEHLRGTDAVYSAISVECRSASCRLVLEHARGHSLSAHRSRLESVQRDIQTFIEADRTSFEPVFLMTAYHQESEVPHIKVFLRRTTGRSSSITG